MFSILSGNCATCSLSSLLNSNISQNPDFVSILWPQLKYKSSFGMIFTLTPFLEKLFLCPMFYKPFDIMNHYFIPQCYLHPYQAPKVIGNFSPETTKFLQTLNSSIIPNHDSLNSLIPLNWASILIYICSHCLFLVSAQTAWLHLCLFLTFW